MDEKKLKEFTKKRTKLIGSLMSSMQTQIAENQRKVYERILDKFIDKLEKDEDGNVKNNDHNRRLLNEIDEVFKEYNKKEGRQTIELLLQSVTSIMSFNQGYFQALDGNARTIKIMPKVKDFMKGWLGIKGDVVEPNGYLDKLIANDPAKIAVKNTAMKVVIGQEGFENAKKQFQTLIDGNKDTLGAFEKHQRNFAFDLYSQIDRATSDTIRADLGFVFAIYEGGLIETSRIFCEEHNGNIYHVSEIKDFNPKEAKPPNYNPITDLGGYGCRHHLNWISTALAKAMGKDVLKFENLKPLQKKEETEKEETKKFELNKENFDEIKKRFDVSNEKSFKDSFEKNMDGFDLVSFDDKIDEELSKFGIKPHIKEIGGFMNRNMTLKIKGKGFEMVRNFKNEDGKKVVYHENLEIEKSIQGKGLTKQIFKNLIKQYENANIDEIRIFANKDIGSYAWAKYGFKPYDKSSFSKVIEKANSTLKGNDLKDFNNWLKNAEAKKDFDLSEIVNSKFGKELLLDSEWSGKLEMKNKIDLQKFKDYINGN